MIVYGSTLKDDDGIVAAAQAKPSGAKGYATSAEAANIPSIVQHSSTKKYRPLSAY